MTIERYGVEDENGEDTSGLFDSYDSAKELARQINGVVIVYEYEFSDSYPDDQADYRNTKGN